MNPIDAINKYSKYVDKFLELFAVSMIIISVTFAFLSVILRYYLGVSYEVLSELSTYSIVFGVFAYFGPLIKQNEHIKMDIVHDIFRGRKIINYIDLFISILLLLSFVFLLDGGISWVSSLYTMGTKTLSGGMTLFVPAMSIVMGMFFGLIYSILEVIKDINKIIKKKN